jgi:hypothetical protein
VAFAYLGAQRPGVGSRPPQLDTEPAVEIPIARISAGMSLLCYYQGRMNYEADRQGFSVIARWLRKVIANPIGRLQRLQIDVHEPMPEMAQVWATETADYPPLYSRPSRPSDSPRGDYPLEFYPDGYPMLPDGLKR